MTDSEATSTEHVVDLAGGQPLAASSGPRPKRGRPSLVTAHIIWDGDIGDRQPGKCIHCEVHCYPKVRKDAVSQHLLHCPALPASAAMLLRQSLAQPAVAAGPKRAKLSPSSMGQRRGPMDGFVHHSFSQQQAVHLEILLLRWFVVANLPFRAVDSPCFKVFMEELSPNLEISS